jgi:CBS domain-containing protein
MKKQSRTVRELLEAKKIAGVLAVKPDDTVLAALKLMAERDIGAVIVMQGERLAGIFSERDYARKVELRSKTASGTKVREVMTEKVLCANLEHTVDQCLTLMQEKRIRHLPVVDGEKVIGVLSARDVQAEYIAEGEQLIQDLTKERLYFTETGGNY